MMYWATCVQVTERIPPSTEQKRGRFPHLAPDELVRLHRIGRDHASLIGADEGPVGLAEADRAAANRDHPYREDRAGPRVQSPGLQIQ